MKVFAVLLVGGVLLTSQASAGPIWDRAKKMFGWDKPEEYNSNVAVAPHYGGGAGPQGYSGGSPGPQAPQPSQGPYGPAGPPRGGPYPGAHRGPMPPSFGPPRPDLQHASSAAYGSYASPSFSGPSYARAPSFGSFPGFGQHASASAYVPQSAPSSFGSYGAGVGDFAHSGMAAPSPANNYGGLFSVVDQTSHIGQMANGDLAASPSEPYASNEDVMKSLLKMVDKPFDLETAASAGHYFSQRPQVAFNPGPHPIMEADRGVIRYRTSPIQIGVADSYSQHHASQHVAAPASAYGHHQPAGFATSAQHSGVLHGSSYGSSALASSALSGAYGDLHAAASAPKKTSAPKA